MQRQHGGRWRNGGNTAVNNKTWRDREEAKPNTLTRDADCQSKTGSTWTQRQRRLDVTQGTQRRRNNKTWRAKNTKQWLKDMNPVNHRMQINAAQTTESPDTRVTFACFRFCSEDGFLWSVLIQSLGVVGRLLDPDVLPVLLGLSSGRGAGSVLVPLFQVSAWSPARSSPELGPSGLLSQLWWLAWQRPKPCSWARVEN